jgi:ferritin-like metal-binding protein YciE
METIMGLFFNKELNSLEDLLAFELDDLYDAEQRLCTAIPKMAEAANSERLKAAFDEHAIQTQRHVSRLEQIFVDMGRSSNRETCEAMKGLINEGKEIFDATGSPEVKDAALIGAAQRVEHYEIAAYGTARTFAQQLGLPDVVRLLQATLDEERQTDERLSELAEQNINVRAGRSAQ